MDKKLIALDLDGTLLNSDGIVSEATKVHLQKLKEKGHIITIATGRILNRALVGTDGAEFANYIVSDAGAAVFKNNEINKEWEEVYAQALSKDTVKNISSYYDKDKFGAAFDGFYFIRDTKGVKPGVKGWPSDKYGVYNLSLNYTADKQTKFYLKVDNVFNKLWAEHTDAIWNEGAGWYSMPGRSFVVGMQYTF